MNVNIACAGKEEAKRLLESIDRLGFTWPFGIRTTEHFPEAYKHDPEDLYVFHLDFDTKKIEMISYYIYLYNSMGDFNMTLENFLKIRGEGTLK